MEQIRARIRGVLLSYSDKVSSKTPSQEYKATVTRVSSRSVGFDGFLMILMIEVID
jgi:hypothetical protein